MLKIVKSTFPIILFLFLTYLSCYGQNGVVKSYYSDGSIESELSYVNDIMDGNGVWYYPNGNVLMKENYQNDKLENEYEEYCIFEFGTA